MIRRNEGLRKYAKEKGVPLWMVGEKFGISETRFSVWLRHELSTKDAERFRKFVDQIAKEQEAND